jgi:DNA-binding YbaB/EbfC family protein
MARRRTPNNMGGMGNMGNMMKQVQKMQKDMEKVQNDLEEREYEASAGGGAITAVVNGKKELIKIELDEDIVDSDDIEMLQDLIITSVNAALLKANQDSEKTMGKVTGGMNIPGMF